MPRIKALGDNAIHNDLRWPLSLSFHKQEKLKFSMLFIDWECILVVPSQSAFSIKEAADGWDSEF